MFPCEFCEISKNTFFNPLLSKQRNISKYVIFPIGNFLRHYDKCKPLPQRKFLRGMGPRETIGGTGKSQQSGKR